MMSLRGSRDKVAGEGKAWSMLDFARYDELERIWVYKDCYGTRYAYLCQEKVLHYESISDLSCSVDSLDLNVDCI